MVSLPIKVLNELKNSVTFYLPLQEGKPIRLGTGRNAVVFLGWTAPEETHTGIKYVAVKFLKNDINSQYARMTEIRFFTEAQKTEDFGQQMEFFVAYIGRGIIGKIDESQKYYFPGNMELVEFENKERDHVFIKNHFFLQGPFYVIELCQGTLHDIFEKDSPWSKAVRVYHATKIYASALFDEAKSRLEDVRLIKEKYMKTDDLENKSGYDILNSFMVKEADRVRNYAVLELFLKIVEKVYQLHEKGLTHRDLKLGNLFLKHPGAQVGFKKLDLKLADLGYVAEVTQLHRGDYSLETDGWRTPGALVPGSQFYRAPEQASLPIEVRVSVDTDKTKVLIRGSKLVDVEKGDWLVIGDFFGGEDPKREKERGLYKIIDREVVCRTSFRLTLNTKKGIKLAEEDDLQAHIIKSTSYHSDGFSLGAILYDLISGGKNPEDFYTYCLVRYHKGFGAENYSIQKILNALSPQKSELSTDEFEFDIPEKKLEFGEKWEIFQQLLSSGNVIELVESGLSSTYEGESIQKAIENYQYRKFPLVSDLLQDNRGVPIPRDIIEIIIKCMLRDVEGTYYSSKTDEGKGFFSEENRKAAEKIHDDVKGLLKEPRNQIPEDFPPLFQDDLLVKLRMFWNYPIELEPEPSRTEEVLGTVLQFDSDEMIEPNG
jgi:serine/threonine protein kinase